MFFSTSTELPIWTRPQVPLNQRSYRVSTSVMYLHHLWNIFSSMSHGLERTGWYRLTRHVKWLRHCDGHFMTPHSLWCLKDVWWLKENNKDIIWCQKSLDSDIIPPKSENLVYQTFGTMGDISSSYVCWTQANLKNLINEIVEVQQRAKVPVGFQLLFFVFRMLMTYVSFCCKKHLFQNAQKSLDYIRLNRGVALAPSKIRL